VRIRVIVAVAAVSLLTACTSSTNGGGGTTTPTSPSAPATTPSLGPDKDPSQNIQGIEIKFYLDPQHVAAPKRVAYDQSPPFGGTHDRVWAACNGVVYKKAVRTEHMVHTLEHGAIWIAYNPDTLPAAGVEALAKKVTGVPYMVMSPYPGLDKPVSLQSWGHRLKLDDPADPRVDEFIRTLKTNKYTHPEPGAPCDSSGFDQDNPPPFDPAPAPAGSAPVGS
jgi:hypothetical protein